VRYDIYGKDVSIANKMESNGEEGHIMVSETTKSMVDRSTEKVPFIFNKIKVPTRNTNRRMSTCPNSTFATLATWSIKTPSSRSKKTNQSSRNPEHYNIYYAV
jgi:hypothetical protein